MPWIIFKPCDLRFLIDIIREDDPRPVKEQVADRYRHGGGWNPMRGHTLTKDWRLQYPGDPELTPLAMITVRQELVVLYRHDFVAIVQPDRSFEVARMD